MKITDLNAVVTPSVEKATPPDRAPRSADSGNHPESAGTRTDRLDSVQFDSVQVSAANELRELAEIVAAKPAEDSDVASVAAAIRNGTYRPNLGALADRLMGDSEIVTAIAPKALDQSDAGAE